MTMHREARLVGIRYVLAYPFEQRSIFGRRRIADGVRDVDRGRARLDCGFDALAQEIEFRARAVFRRPFYVLDMVSGARHLRNHHLVDFVRLLLELVFHVHGRGGEKRVNARTARGLHGFSAAVDVVERCTRKPTDNGVLRALCDL